MENKEKANFQKPFIKWGIGVISIVLAYWGVMFLLYKTKICPPWLEPNEFGDMFGFLSCLFSGFAFSGLVITLRQQQKSLNLQSTDLQTTQAALSEQTGLQNKLLQEEERRSIYNQIDSFRSNLRNITKRFIEAKDLSSNEAKEWKIYEGSLAADRTYIKALEELGKLSQQILDTPKFPEMYRGHFDSFLNTLDFYRHKTKELYHIIIRINLAEKLSSDIKEELYDCAIDSLPPEEYKLFILQFQRQEYWAHLPHHVKKLFSSKKAWHQLYSHTPSNSKTIVQKIYTSLCVSKMESFSSREIQTIEMQNRNVAIYNKEENQRWEKFLKDRDTATSSSDGFPS